MFQSQAICSAQNFTASRRRGFFSAEPGVTARRLLPVLAAGALATALAATTQNAVPAPNFTSPVIVQDHSVTAVRDKAEAMRASLLAQPGVGAVTITGLRQQGLAVEYTPHRLAEFGLTPASLIAALPTDPAQSRPGHLVLRPEAAGELQSVADLPVRADARVFRLGDVAMVMRTPLAAPISTMDIDGQPSAELRVTAAR